MRRWAGAVEIGKRLRGRFDRELTRGGVRLTSWLTRMGFEGSGGPSGGFSTIIGRVERRLTEVWLVRMERDVGSAFFSLNSWVHSMVLPSPLTLQYINDISNITRTSSKI